VVALGVILGGLVGALLWASMLLGPWRLASGLLDARDHLGQAQDAAANGATKEARNQAVAARGAADRAARGLENGGPLLEVAALMPTIGDALGEAGHMVAAARHSALAADASLDIAQNALKGPEPLIEPDPDDPEGGSRIRIDRIEAVAARVEGIRAELEAAQRELEAVRLARLPRRAHDAIRRGIATARDTALVLADAQAGLELLPRILGAEGPRTYLFGFQNTAEQRGTGGAILSFAPMTITDGKPELAGGSSSVYQLDKKRDPIDIPLPEDAWYVAGIEDAQRFGNANWSPDWPLSAKLTAAYGAATPSDEPFPHVDGIINVDPLAVQQLMPGTGPFHIKAGHRISERRVVHFLLYKAYASYPVAAVRRHVLDQVVDAFYKRMLDPLHPTDLLTGMGSALAKKHMQIWMADPAEQRFIERMDWDGGIEDAANSDYAYVVEQNVGGNKLDFFDRQTNEMDVRLDGDDAEVATTIRIQNRVFLPQPRYSMGDTQSKRACAVTRCPTHRPMINLYVQPGAELLATPAIEGAERLDTPPPAVWIGGQPATHMELGKKVWSATLQIEPGEEGSLRFDYLVPGVVRTVDGRRVYRLQLQHQPKVHPETFVVRLTLPPGASDVQAKGWKRDGDQLVWERPLEEDVALEVSWRE